MTIRPRPVVVATHGHCFDGFASAVVFTRLYEQLHGTAATFRYNACDYGPGEGVLPARLLCGKDNAILDYRYTASPAVTWYFDHHATAFPTADDRSFYDARPTLRGAYDPAYPSCTQLIADVALREYGVSLDEYQELIAWATRIDTAHFVDAADAVRRDHPVLQLMTVIEHQGNDALLNNLVTQLLTRPVGEVALTPEIQTRYAPLAQKRAAALEIIRLHLKRAGNIAVCDLTDNPMDVVEKFAPYLLYPESLYAVVLARTHRKIKVSVGFNPWSTEPRRHDIGAICLRHGGGGHPFVGAFTRPVAQLAEAQALAAAIIEELQR